MIDLIVDIILAVSVFTAIFVVFYGTYDILKVKTLKATESEKKRMAAFMETLGEYVITGRSPGVEKGSIGTIHVARIPKHDLYFAKLNPEE